MLCVICRVQEGVFSVDGAGDICPACKAELASKEEENKISLLSKEAVYEMVHCAT